MKHLLAAAIMLAMTWPVMAAEEIKPGTPLTVSAMVPACSSPGAALYFIDCKALEPGIAYVIDEVRYVQDDSRAYYQVACVSRKLVPNDRCLWVIIGGDPRMPK